MELAALLEYRTAAIEVVAAREAPGPDAPLWVSVLPGGYVVTPQGVSGPPRGGAGSGTATGAGAGGPAAALPSRRSRRSRATLEVTPSTTVQELKLQILQALNIHPGNAQLFLNGKELTDDTQNMRQCRVFPNQTLVVVSRGLHDDNDLTGIRFPGDARAVGPREEHGVGFGGTLLAAYGSVASAAMGAAEEGERGPSKGRRPLAIRLRRVV